MPRLETRGHTLLPFGFFVPRIPDHPGRDDLIRRYWERRRNSVPPDSPDKQGSVVFPEPSTNGSEPTNGKRYIKHPELTHPPMI